MCAACAICARYARSMCAVNVQYTIGMCAICASMCVVNVRYAIGVRGMRVVRRRYMYGMR